MKHELSEVRNIFQGLFLVPLRRQVSRAEIVLNTDCSAVFTDKLTSDKQDEI